MAPIIITLELFKAQGGPVKTVSFFRKALNAHLFSFAHRNKFGAEPLADPFAEWVQVSTWPVLKQYAWVPKNSRLNVETAASVTSLISCHAFFRYHIEFVHQVFCRYKTPYWHVPHGVLDPYVFGNRSIVKKAFLNRVGLRFLSDASCCIFATEREKEKAESIFGDLRGEVVHWPVELPDLSSIEGGRQRLRQRWGVSEEDRILLSFGRLHPMKRPLETIRAVAALNDPRLWLLVMGPASGVSLTDCRREAVRLGFKRLILLEPVYGDLKYDIICACDGYISLSHRENFNHCAAESLATGLPVILSPGNDLGPLVVASGAGCQLADNSDRSLRVALEAFVSCPKALLIVQGQKGRALVAQLFSFSVFKEKLNQLYQKHRRVL